MTKTYTETQFIAALKSIPASAYSAAHGIVGTDYDDGVTTVQGCAWQTVSTDWLTACWCLLYSHPEHAPSAVETSDAVEVWSGADYPTVTDAGDFELSSSDIEDLILEHTDIDEIDLSAILPDDPEPEGVDAGQVSDLLSVRCPALPITTHTLTRDGDRDLRFRGVVFASASSEIDDCGLQKGRWAELDLYITVGGKYVCAEIGKTAWDGEHDRYSVKICSTEAEVVEFFGLGWLAKNIYASAEIECVECVEEIA